MRSRPPTSQRTRSGRGGAFRCAPPGRARPPNRGTSERHEPPRRDYLKAPPPWHENVAHREAQTLQSAAGYVGKPDAPTGWLLTGWRRVTHRGSATHPPEREPSAWGTL